MNETCGQTRGLLHRIGIRHAAWLAIAFLLLAVFGALHLLGWRDDTAIISGTAANPNSTLRGLLYGMSYFLAVRVSPILILGAGISAALRRAAPR